MEVPDGGRDANPSPRSAKRPLFMTWLVTFVLLSTLEWFWVVSSPLGSGFDEPSHVIKAAAVVRGEWLGQPVAHLSRAYMWMIVPGTYSQLVDRSVCYKAAVTVPAKCEPGIVPSEAPVRALTHVGRYPPLYYLVAGVPSLFGDSTAALYGMRLFGAMASAALIALAVALAVAYAGGGLLLAAVIAATTPGMFYLASIVEPSSLEISAAICLWTALLLLIRRRLGGTPRPLVFATAGSAVVLDLTRGFSPIWLSAVLFVSLVVLTPSRRLRELWKDSAVRTGAAVLGAVTCLAVAWTLATHSLAFVSVHPNHYAHATYPVILKAILGRTFSYVVEMLGGFNPKHTEAPVGVLVLVGACVVVLVAVAVRRGSGRERFALGLIAVATVLAPLVLASVHARTVGIIWQGRYVLPLTVGLPIIAGSAAEGARRGWRRSRGGSRIIPSVIVTSALLGQLLALYGLLRRFAVGNNGPVSLTLTSAGAWSPPIPAVAVICGTATATALTVAWLIFLLARASESRHADRGGSTAVAGDGPAQAGGAGGAAPDRSRQRREEEADLPLC